MENVQLAEALFDALARGDDQAVRSLCSPALRVHQNMGQPMSIDSLLAFNQAVGRVLKDLRYCEAIRSATATGFVEEHRLKGTLPDGSALNLAVCVVAIVENGKVTEVREYFDSAPAAGLVAALR
ncbi:MAG: nuclear transport factor 2 family protein [Novosphingobium sp.]|jgi:ketosteroid isomerase-like protein|nr:nuclear transport factor 2 family protein [Novosphingobium sp.]